jgi:hypothetical protein
MEGKVHGGLFYGSEKNVREFILFTPTFTMKIEIGILHGKQS